MITLSTVLAETQTAGLVVAKWASAEDHAASEKRLNKSARKNFLLTRAALRALLAQVTGASGWTISPGPRGKPQAVTAAGTAGPLISLSHTHGLVACAVSRGSSLGIDVEYWRARDFMALADYAFGPRECEEVGRDGMSAFYRLWTLREAHAKATGEGLPAATDGRDRVHGNPDSVCWTRDAWQFFYTRPRANYSLAIASQGEDDWSEASLAWIDPLSV